MSITLTARKARPAIGLILLTMSLGVLIAQIDTCVVNLAVNPIGTDLKAGVSSAKACRTPVEVRTRRRREQMRKTNFAAIAAGALILAGIVGWTTGSNRPLQAKASTAIEAQIDKELPIEECAN